MRKPQRRPGFSHLSPHRRAPAGDHRRRDSAGAAGLYYAGLTDSGPGGRGCQAQSVWLSHPPCRPGQLGPGGRRQPECPGGRRPPVRHTRHPVTG
eukprot:214300-Hanusia_phi.AAC.1